MTSVTPNYGLTLFNDTTDPSTQDVLDFRSAQSGTGAGSNMNLIDTALADLQDQIETLGTTIGLIKVYANEITTGNYVADGVLGISSYVLNLSILLAIDISVTGTSTININSLGTKSLMKINSSGTPVNLSSGDLHKERFYIFTYDGTRFIWDNALSSDQIPVVSGVTGDFVRVATDKSIQTSGNDPTDFATAAQGVTNGNTHDHVGGDGAQIDYTGLSNLPSYKKIYDKEDFGQFNTTGAISKYYTGITSGGTFTQMDSEASHNGIFRINLAAEGNRAYIVSNANSVLLNGEVSFNAIFQILNLDVFRTILGFGNVPAAYTDLLIDGVWINIDNATLTGRTANNSSRSTTGTSYTISASTWYRLNISINIGATTVTYTLYDMSNSVLWTNTLSANIPTARTTSLLMYSEAYSTPVNPESLKLDYFDWFYSQSR